uniref:Uncharacterized protein n=1 Tax=viral metagenome TaxID=1070528 RepID=A0A6C0DEC5_9ZZZZ
MDFVKITEDFVQEEQVDDIGFIENNKFYNTSSLNDNSKDIQNKRVFPPSKLLAKNVGGPNSNTNTNIIGRKPETKKVTYDDILSSLNMKIVNGKLQIVRGDADSYQSASAQKNQMTSSNIHLRQQQPQPQQQQFIKPYSRNTYATPKNINTPNHAYAKQNEFYNKFLQAQSQGQSQGQGQAQEGLEPLTPEEKKRLLMIQYIKHQQEKQHISRVKSRKLSFV